jgi:hypothetical protein
LEVSTRSVTAARQDARGNSLQRFVVQSFAGADRPLLIFLLLVGLATGATLGLTMSVPVVGPLLPAGLADQYWQAALVSAATIMAINVVFMLTAVQRRRSWRPQRSQAMYAGFLALAVLQLGHVGEHVVQVTQLLVTNGDLSRAHGAVGQLDFETVHFVWDGGIWLCAGLLLTRRPCNGWLWLAFLIAGVHQIEHGYLFWVYEVHRGFYTAGGYAGILGRGGVLGSPLYRPYLHFLYNVFVGVPLVLAFWRQLDLTVRRQRALQQRFRDAGGSDITSGAPATGRTLYRAVRFLY